MIKTILSFVLLACQLLLMRPCIFSAELKVTCASPVHPILIRNEHGPIVKVVVDVPTGMDIEVGSLEFSLEGTDAFTDIKSLSLYWTGSEEGFSSEHRFGDSQTPMTKITFQGNRTLSSGRNTFWLDCKLTETADLSHHVSASCTRLKTGQAEIQVSNEAPTVRHRIGVALRRHQDDGVHTYRIPALGTSAKGTLLCVYDMRRRMGRDLQEDIDIGLSRSTDGGQSWEPVRVIMDMGEYGGLSQELNGCSDPGLIVDRETGEIFCFALWMNGKPGKHQWVEDGSEPGFEIGKTAQFMMVSSKDDGLTWSKPVNLTGQLK